MNLDEFLQLKDYAIDELFMNYVVTAARAPGATTPTANTGRLLLLLHQMLPLLLLIQDYCYYYTSVDQMLNAA